MASQSFCFLVCLIDFNPYFGKEKISFQSLDTDGFLVKALRLSAYDHERKKFVVSGNSKALFFWLRNFIFYLSLSDGFL